MGRAGVRCLIACASIGAMGALGAMLSLEPASGAGDASRWVIDPGSTHIVFAVTALGYPRTQGEFRQFVGSIRIDLDRPARSSVEFVTKSGSADVGSDAFNEVIRSAPFLNAGMFREIAFRSTAVEKTSATTVRVTGDLTMLGATRPLTVDVQVGQRDPTSHRRLTFSARGSIDRLAFGMTAGYPVISRDVDIVVASEAIEK